jgi:hypothetical protein
MTTHITGLRAKTYYNTATHATPTWVEIKRLVNETVDFGKGTADQMNRESEWKRILPTLKELTPSFTYQEKKNQADTVWDALWDSYLADTIVEFAFMDASIATTGNKGFLAGAIVTKMAHKRELEGIVEWDVELGLAEFVEAGALVEPERFVVPA